MTEALDTAFHGLHLLAACLWVGSMIFVSLILQPVLRNRLPAGLRLELYREVGRRFSWLQWGAWGVLAATGAWRLWGLRESSEVFYGPFGHILAVKLALVGFMVTLSLLHSQVWGPRMLEIGPEDSAFAPLVARMARWGKVNLALVVGVLFCAALLRFNPW